MEFNLDNKFNYENGFYLTSTVARISKFVAHLDFFRETSGLRGEIVECGVFKGASLSRLVKFRSLLENPTSRKIVAFDVFGEFPKAGFEDEKVRDSFVSQAGSEGYDEKDLMDLFSKLGLQENLELVKGDVCQTVPEYIRNHPELRLSLLNIDVDLYEPTKTCLKTFFPKVVPGGIIILDDYGAFPGATRAVEEYFSDNPLKIESFPYVSSIAYIRKPFV